jgi:4-hydroxy-tetrahydrodipicolinate reductase
MRAIILGDGAMGHAVAAAITERGDTVLGILGRPATPAGHQAGIFGGADVTLDFTTGEAVLPNLSAAAVGGCRRFVVGTTGWDAHRPAVEAMLAEMGATCVAAPNFSLGVAFFLRIVEEATHLFGAVEAYDPYLVEWHRRTKSDRPSGTARELSRRIIAAHPRKRRISDPGATGPPAPDELDVSVIRAGASPGMHLVGFDAPGETVELRLTARDRSAYAAGALASADWLLAADHPAGLHPFDAVVAGLFDWRDAAHAPNDPVAPAVATLGRATDRSPVPVGPGTPAASPRNQPAPLVSTRQARHPAATEGALR